MSANDNFELSRVPEINEVFPIVGNHENMPVTFYIDDLKEVIFFLSEQMISADKEERDQISIVMGKISGVCKSLNEMKQAVLAYASKAGQ